MPVSIFNSVRRREDALPRHHSALAATFRSEASGSPDMIHRMELQRTLEGHGGCVNTVAFNPAGDLLISGSDDQSVMLWDWRRGVRRLRFEPGHSNNIFQARTLPGTSDKTLVSCAADGQVRVSYFTEGSSRPVTKRLHRHQGRAHKLALQYTSPYDSSYGGSGGGGPPCLYSSGEDGDVCFFDLRVSDTEPLARMAATAGGPTAFTNGGGGGGGPGSDGPRRSRPRQVIDLNAVHVNPARPWQLVVGGADEAVVVYDNRVLTSLTSSYVSSSSSGGGTGGGRGGGPLGGGGGGRTRCQRVHGRPLLELCPAQLRNTGSSAFRRPTHVTCVLFADNGDVLATYNDDDIYLFRPPGTQGSGGGRGAPGTTGSDDEEDGGAGGGGRPDRAPAGPSCRRARGKGAQRDMEREEEAEEEEEEDESFLRPSRRRRRGGGGGGGGSGGGTAAGNRGSGAGADGEDAGDYVIGRYSGHRNNRTVKGVNFLGERQEWVVSGSDCGHVYIWSRATARLHAWLRGDSYVVNCLEPHPTLPLHLATSGIDDDIKLWAPTAEQARPPGPAAEAAMHDNGRQRAAAQSRTGGGGLVIPRAVLRALLGRLEREDDEGRQDGRGGGARAGAAAGASGPSGSSGGRGSTSGGGRGGGHEDSGDELRSLLLSALHEGGLLSDDDDDEEEDDEEGDEDEDGLGGGRWGDDDDEENDEEGDDEDDNAEEEEEEHGSQQEEEGEEGERDGPRGQVEGSGGSSSGSHDDDSESVEEEEKEG